MAAPYRIESVVHEKYLHATAYGLHSQENMSRFLGDAHEACVANRKDSVLLDVRFDGPTIGIAGIFSVVQQRIGQARGLRRIAYTDSARDPEKTKFAETVARNRGVNVRLFATLEEATKWLES